MTPSYKESLISDDLTLDPEALERHDDVQVEREPSDGGHPPQYWAEYDTLLRIARHNATWAQIVNMRDGFYQVHGFVHGHGIVDSSPKADRRDALRAFIVEYHGADALTGLPSSMQTAITSGLSKVIDEWAATRDKPNGSTPKKSKKKPQ